jgi:serine/threonine protein kinase
MPSEVPWNTIIPLLGRPDQRVMPELDAHLTQALADRYTLRRELGRGGMAIVYLAHDRKLDRDVALKVLRPELAASLGAERFLREIEIAAKLTHPNILPLYDCGATRTAEPSAIGHRPSASGFLYYTMPFVAGESLRDRLSREKQLPIDEALQITTEVADALGHAHALGIVHRDIKPENILFSAGHAVVSDFGIARAVSAAGVGTLTETGLAIGTPAYMSPEQASGAKDIDGRSDIYALGCVLYEMLSGEAPYLGNTPQAVVAKKLSEPAPRVSVVRDKVPPAVEAALDTALSRTPADRFATAARFAEALFAESKAAAPEIKSIVVLPFENLSPDPDQAYFGDGLTEEVIADLSKVRSLRVISRTSAMLLKGSQKDVPTIARDLNVRYVLEGSVRRAGTSLRITAQLIEAATDGHLWAEKYSGTLEDVFDLQEQLSRRIVEALKVTLAPDEDRQLASRDIPDVEAFALYLRARQEFARMTEASIDLAEQLVERALARTGPNALLLATAAEIGYLRHDQGLRPTAETLDRADLLAARALTLNPDLAEAHVARGLVAWRRFDAPASVRHLLRAVELDPSNATAAWAAAYVLAEIGRTGEARALGDRAHALDPLYWPAQAGSVLADLFDGCFDSALAKAAGMHSISGGGPAADLLLGVCLYYAGRSDEAVAAFDRLAAAGAGPVSAFGTFLGAMVRGEAAAMRALLAEPATREIVGIDKELSWMAAVAFASIGDSDEALHSLSGAIEMGFINHRFFAEHDPFLATLRGDPRFEALMERARAKEREIEAAA